MTYYIINIYKMGSISTYDRICTSTSYVCLYLSLLSWRQPILLSSIFMITEYGQKKQILLLMSNAFCQRVCRTILVFWYFHLFDKLSETLLDWFRQDALVLRTRAGPFTGHWQGLSPSGTPRSLPSCGSWWFLGSFLLGLALRLQSSTLAPDWQWWI